MGLPFRSSSHLLSTSTLALNLDNPSDLTVEELDKHALTAAGLDQTVQSDVNRVNQDRQVTLIQELLRTTFITIFLVQTLVMGTIWRDETTLMGLRHLQAHSVSQVLEARYLSAPEIYSRTLWK